MTASVSVNGTSYQRRCPSCVVIVRLKRVKEAGTCCGWAEPRRKRRPTSTWSVELLLTWSVSDALCGDET